VSSTSDKLIAFRIFGVSSEFIQCACALEGPQNFRLDKTRPFRYHGVSPEMIRSVRQMGYSPDETTLIAMRIHGARRNGSPN